MVSPFYLSMGSAGGDASEAHPAGYGVEPHLQTHYDELSAVKNASDSNSVYCFSVCKKCYIVGNTFQKMFHPQTGKLTPYLDTDNAAGTVAFFPLPPWSRHLCMVTIRMECNVDTV